MSEQLLSHPRQQQIVDSILANGNSGIIDWHHQQIITERACMALDELDESARKHGAPTAVYRPTLSKDGDKWCFLLGDDLQIGLAGFGDTPQAAAVEFDKAFAGEPDA